MRELALIDLAAIVHPLFHMTGSDPNPDATSIQTVARVRSIASGQPSVAVCYDVPPYFRKDIAPDYKGQRPPSDAVLIHQLNLALDVLRADGFPCWGVKGFESDDVICSAVTWALTFEDILVRIHSSDKDIYQLVGPRVEIRSLKDGATIDEAAVLQRFGVPPSAMCDFLSLTGDASDNIKGCTNVGEKKAADLLKNFGTLEGIYDALTNHGTRFTPALATNLREFQPRMAATRALVTMRTDVPVPFDEVFRPRVPSDTAVFGRSITAAIGGVEMAEEADHTVVTEHQPPVAVEPTAAELFDTAKANAQHRAEAEAQAAKPSTALAQAPPSTPPALVGWDGFEPNTMHQAAWLAEQMFKSRLFSAYGSMQAVLSTFLAGKELGLSMMASLRAFHIIEGKPCLAADLIRAITIRSPQCDYFRCTSRTAEGATFVTKRKGDDEPISLTFTVAEGRAAWPKDDAAFTKSGWGRNPADMCVARASAKLARLVYPDVVHGFYAPEEFE